MKLSEMHGTGRVNTAIKSNYILLMIMEVSAAVTFCAGIFSITHNYRTVSPILSALLLPNNQILRCVTASEDGQ